MRACSPAAATADRRTGASGPGARLLPAASRRHVHAVYTLARLADDIVDLAGPEPGPETAAELDAFEASFWQALADGTSTDPVMAAVATSVLVLPATAILRAASAFLMKSRMSAPTTGRNINMLNR